MINHLIVRIQKKIPFIDELSYTSILSSEPDNKTEASTDSNTEERLWVNKKTLIHNAWNASSMAPLIFARYHLPHCDSCAVRFDESLAEASEAYQIPLDRWLMALNFEIVEPDHD